MEHGGFTERRLARLGGATDAHGLFASRYVHPAPSPDGSLLAWISDRDGRPRAWVAPLPPDGAQVVEPDRPLPADGDVETMSWSPDGLDRLPGRPARRGAHAGAGGLAGRQRGA